MRSRWLMLAGVALGLIVPNVMADPPGRVGRLNLINGTVSFRPASLDDWAPAEPNRIVTTGDGLWTDDNSRAEVHVGSTAIRVGPQTAFDFVNVDDQTLQGRLAQGRVSVRVRLIDEGQVYEIDTPNGAVSLTDVGDYRIEVSGDGNQSRVTVWSGGAEVMAAGSSFQVHEHQFASITGTDSPTFDLEDVGPRDDWDHWCAGRDHREDNSQSLRYVSREMPGYEDLDEAGHWIADAEFGNVWIPDSVPPGWAPYHRGHWVWRDPWGWSWIDAAPWGFAPFHYGRWAYVRSRWAWSPFAIGVAIVARPIFAPALVAFIGGPHWNIGIAGGVVAWVPLGPGEVYRPAYAVSNTYIRNVNITNVRNVTNITNITNVNNTTIINNYRNVNVHNAVMAVPTTAIAGGHNLAQVAVPVTRQQLMAAPAPAFAPHIVPTREAVIGGGLHAGAPGHVATPPQMLMNRQVVAKVAPPPKPIPFVAQQQLLAANNGKPLELQQQVQLRQTALGLQSTGMGPFKPASIGAGLKPKRADLAPAMKVAPVSGSGFVQPMSHTTLTTAHPTPVTGTGPTFHTTSTTVHPTPATGTGPTFHTTSTTVHPTPVTGTGPTFHTTSTTVHPTPVTGTGHTTFHTTSTTVHPTPITGTGPTFHTTSTTVHPTPVTGTGHTTFHTTSTTVHPTPVTGTGPTFHTTSTTVHPTPVTGTGHTTFHTTSTTVHPTPITGTGHTTFHGTTGTGSTSHVTSPTKPPVQPQVHRVPPRPTPKPTPEH